MSRVNLSGRATTAGAAEETLNLSKDGAVAAASVAVAANTILEIKDIVAMASAIARVRVQQDNGSGFFDVLNVLVPANDTKPIPLGAPIQVKGGTSVAVRARVETPGGAALVALSMQAELTP